MLDTILIILALGGLEYILWRRSESRNKQDADEQLAILHAIYSELPRPKPRKKKSDEPVEKNENNSVEVS